ncbi:hypothetical protein KJ564_00330 [bacterium]|nr:hypothetical protein [bacterium]MBU1880508.1 hypothetical protein [bacterium]
MMRYRIKTIGRFGSLVLLAALLLGCAGTRKNDPAVALRSQRVQSTLSDIADGLNAYHQERGYFPKGLATLRETGLVSIMPDVEREWTIKYYVDGDKVMMIEAVSRTAMPDGEGYSVVYRVPNSEWEGYGITEFPK